MKKTKPGFVLMLVGTFFLCTDSLQAQSGSRRAGSGSRGSSASRSTAPRRSTPSTVSRGRGGRSGRSAVSVSRKPQLSPAKQQQLQIQETLVALGAQQNAGQNQQQTQLAKEEAKRDFENLQNKRVSPNQLSSLTHLFRLDGSQISKESRTVDWPETLSANQYESAVSDLDNQILTSKIKDDKSAKAFLKTLGELNANMNSAAAAGELELDQYVESRVFLTGLANEIRATGLIM